MASKKVNIVDNTNEVSVTNSNNKIEIVNTNTPSNIEVTQRTTTLVQVNAAGPKGDRGPIGPAVSFDSGSYVTTGSFNSFTSSYNSGSFSGSFFGDGSGLTNIPASGIVGLNLSQIASGSVSASISPNNGFVVNTNIDASGNITASGNISSSATITANAFVGEGSGILGIISASYAITASHALNTVDTSLFVTTGSFNTFTGSINSFTSSIQSEVDNLTLQTGSYATTGSNNFIGNQVITGSLIVSGSSTFTNIGPAIFSGTSTFTNITSSGNISSSGNVITTEVTASKITSGDSTLILGYAGSNNITIEDDGDFFIDASLGTLEIYGQSANIYVSNDITLDGNVIATSNITASALTSNDGQLFLGFSDDENITIQEGADVFINAQNGYIEMYGDGAEVTVGGNVITLNASVNATSDITASGNISASGNIITTEVTASKITSGDSNLILGYAGSNNIDIQNNSDLFINSPGGGVFIESRDGPILEVTDVITLNGNVIATSNITASGNISSSGTITGTTGSFNHIIGTVANVIWTIDFTDGELSTRLYAPYNLSIDSVTNITGSSTTSITSSGSPYTLGNAITIGAAIDVTSSISSVINLNITR
jgi:hypothetical protein